MLIYKLTHRASGKVYVGQTKRTLSQRCALHRSAVKRGSKTAIASAIRKYGWDAFDVEVLQECHTSEALNEAEQVWIAKLSSLAPEGYNLRTGGQATYELSEEARARLRKPRARHSEESRAERSARMKGMVFSDTHRQRLSQNALTRSGLTWERVREIRSWKTSNDATVMETARHFGVSFGATQRLLANETWIDSP